MTPPAPEPARIPLYVMPSSLTDTPMHYCAGCGHSTVHKLIAEVMDELGLADKAIGVAPVGCAVFAYFYLACDFIEAAHGRAAAIATGLKRARPDRLIFSYQGDGDLAAIGLAETVHAANRGENITVIFINNAVYGMTGGQMAPTTLLNQKTSTTPRGRDAALAGAPLRMCELLNTLSLPYAIERTALDGPGGVLATRRAIRAAFQAQMEGRGYTFVEVLAPCPTYQRLTPLESLAFVRERMGAVFPVRVFRKQGVPVDA